MLALEDKKAIVAEVADIAANAQSLIAADYRGLSVADMTELRVKARGAGVFLRVIKNTLARRALAETSFACAGESLAGPLVMAFSTAEPSAAARVLNDFAKEHNALEIKIIALDGRLLDPQDIDMLARMPTREEAIAMLMGLMKAPIEKMVRTLAEPTAKMVRTVAAVRDQKQVA